MSHDFLERLRLRGQLASCGRTLFRIRRIPLRDLLHERDGFGYLFDALSLLLAACGYFFHQILHAGRLFSDGTDGFRHLVNLCFAVFGLGDGFLD
jgi:hypothetical protein